MSRRNERAIRRQIGLTGRIWCWRELKDLATELALGEEARVVSLVSHPPTDTPEWGRMGWLMATNRRLIFVGRGERKRRVSLPLDSIHSVDAERIFGSCVLAVQAEDQTVEFGIYSDWPKRRAKTTLTAFADHLREQPSQAAGLRE